MGTTFWLPRLNIDNDLDPGQDNGWVRDLNQESLKRIYEGLDISTTEVQKVESVPSMWARATLFDIAILADEKRQKNNIDKVVVEEWRGLLALLAFRDMLQFEIAFERISFDDHTLFNKYKSQLPRNSLDKSIDWNVINIIKCNNRPIGFFSPSTLVCTGSDYCAVLNQVKWFDGQRLVDPCHIITGKHKELLAYWLLMLKESISRYEFKNTERSGPHNIMEMISQYMMDLGYPDITRQNDPNVYNSRLPMITDGIYKFVSAPLVFNGEITDLKLIGDYPSTEGVLLYTDEMFNKEDHHVLAFGGTTLDVVKASKNSFGYIGKQKLGKNRLFKGEEWLFNDELYLVNEEYMHEDYHSNYALCWEIDGITKNVMVIYPLKREVLDHFVIDTVVSNFKVDTINEKGENKVKVQIDIKLSGGFQRFTKIYENKHVHAFTNVPLTAVWPSYDLGEHWHAYYVYNNRPNASREYTDFTIAPYTQDGNVERYIQENMEVNLVKSYPKVFTVSYNGKEIGFIKNIKPISTLSNSNVFQQECKVGIDFGTCASTVYYTTNREEIPKILKFPQRSNIITMSSHLHVLMEDFLPFSTQENLTTIAQHFQTMFRYYDDNPRKALMHGNINYQYILPERSEAVFGGIATNIKWESDGSISAKCSKPFLEQIILQALLELVINKIDVKNATWHFSYPTALKNSKVEQFESNCRDILENCYKDILNLDFDPSTQLLTMTESVAAARYILNDKTASTTASLHGGFISADIGGGTTDISIWQKRAGSEENYIYQTSVKFAGRDLFINTLRLSKDHSKILDLLELGSNEYNNSSDTSIEYIEKCLTKDKAYRVLSNKEQMREIKLFIETLSFGVAGLFYFIGLILKKLYQNEVIDDFKPSIYFGGNGSKLFNWLAAGGEFSSDKLRGILFQRMMMAACDGDQKVEISITKNLKAEAAGGMVVRDNLIIGKKDMNMKSSEILLGETVILADGNELMWSNSLSDLLDDCQIKTLVIDNLKGFIQSYNDHYKELFDCRQDIIRFDQQKEKDLISQILDELHRLQKNKDINKSIFLIGIDRMIGCVNQADLINYEGVSQ